MTYGKEVNEMAMMAPMIGREIGERAKTLLAQRGLTQGQLAIKSGLNQATISKLMAGGVKDPPVGTVIRVATALDASLYALLGLEDMPEPTKHQPVDPGLLEALGTQVGDVARSQAATTAEMREMSERVTLALKRIQQLEGGQSDSETL
jgi:transcriptional regulator with XRE-family HTH domain